MQSKASTRPQESSDSTPSEATPSQDETKTLNAAQGVKSAPTGGENGGVVGSTASSGESAPIRAPASLWRCSRIMHLLRDLHPTLLSALEGIVDQVRMVDCIGTLGQIKVF